MSKNNTAKAIEILLQPLILENALHQRKLSFLITEALDAKTILEINKNINLAKKSLEAFKKAYKEMTDGKSGGTGVSTNELDAYLDKFEEFLNKHIYALAKSDDEDDDKLRKISASALNAVNQYLGMMDVLEDAIAAIKDSFKQAGVAKSLDTGANPEKTKREKEAFGKLMSRTMGTSKGGWGTLASVIKSFGKEKLSGIPQPPVAGEKAWKDFFDALLASNEDQVNTFLNNLKTNKEAIKTTVDAMTTTITSDSNSKTASTDSSTEKTEKNDENNNSNKTKTEEESKERTEKEIEKTKNTSETRPASPTDSTTLIKTNDIIDASLKWRFQRKAINKTVRNNLKNNLNKALKDAGIINKDIFESIENKKVLRESNREKEYQFARMQKLAGLEE